GPPPFPSTTLFRSRRLHRLLGLGLGGVPQERLLAAHLALPHWRELGVDGERQAERVAVGAAELGRHPRREIDPLLRLQAVGADLHTARSEEHTSELQSRENLVCRLLLEKKNV